MKLALEMDEFSLASLENRGVLRELLTQTESVETMDGVRMMQASGKKKGLPQGVQLDLTLTSKKAELSSVPMQDLQLAAVLKEGYVSLSQLSGKLEGAGQFVLKGEVESSFEGLALKGQLDVGGADFVGTVHSIFGDTLEIPARLKQYRGRGNIFLTQDLLRVSEMILRAEDLQVLGTILRKHNDVVQDIPKALGTPEVAHVDFNYEGAIRIDKLNLDEWHVAQKDPEYKELEAYPKLLRVAKSWQKRATHAAAEIKVSLIDMTLNGQSRPRAAVSFIVNGGGVALSNIEMPYNGTYISGSIAVGFPQKGAPEVQADLKADILNTSEFFEHDFAADEDFWRDKSGNWSRKELAIGWMHQFNGTVKLAMGSLTHDILEFTNLNAEVLLKDGTMQIKQLSSGFLGGETSVRAQMTASKLPSMSGAISLNGVSFEKLRKLTDLVGDLTGKLSMSGEFSSTGINPQIVVQNAQGVIAVAGAGINVVGFNLANLVRAANTVRTVADINKLVQYANQGGATYIDTLKGNISLGSGFLRTPGIVISTKESNGSINGQLGLTDWDLNGAIILYLTTLQQQSPPSVRLVFTGPLKNTARTLETQSLESFIAKQSAERILETE